MSEQPEQKEPWQMTRVEYARQRKLRAAAWKTVAEEKAGRRQAAREAGFPQGRVYGLIEKLADLPQLSESHRQVVEEALSRGLPVPPEVLAGYPDLASGEAAAGSRARVGMKGAAGRGQAPGGDKMRRQGKADLVHVRRALIVSLWNDVREGGRGCRSDETLDLAGRAAALKAALLQESQGESAGASPPKKGAPGRRAGVAAQAG
jgi:hypothetical protein